MVCCPRGALSNTQDRGTLHFQNPKHSEHWDPRGPESIKQGTVALCLSDFTGEKAEALRRKRGVLGCRGDQWQIEDSDLI